MTTNTPSNRPSSSTILIIGLLVANLGLSTYNALRPQTAPANGSPKDAVTSAVSTAEANKIEEAVVPLFNSRNVSAIYDKFDPLAKAQFTKDQLAAQVEKLGTLVGRIEGCAYSHATVAGTEGGRTYYTLHYKVSLSGGPIPNGDLTITVTRNADGLGLFGFFINGSSNLRGQ